MNWGGGGGGDKEEIVPTSFPSAFHLYLQSLPVFKISAKHDCFIHSPHASFLILILSVCWMGFGGTSPALFTYSEMDVKAYLI